MQMERNPEVPLSNITKDRKDKDKQTHTHGS